MEQQWRRCGSLDMGGDWDAFANLLLSDTIKKIKAHNLIENPEVGDLRYWKEMIEFFATPIA